MRKIKNNPPKHPPNQIQGDIGETIWVVSSPVCSGPGPGFGPGPGSGRAGPGVVPTIVFFELLENSFIISFFYWQTILLRQLGLPVLVIDF